MNDSTSPTKRQQINKNLLMTAKLPDLDVFCDLLKLNPETVCVLTDHQIDVYNLMKKNYYDLDDLPINDSDDNNTIMITKKDQIKIKNWIKARHNQSIQIDEQGEDKQMVVKDFWEMSIALCPPTLEWFCKVLNFTDYTMCLFLETDIAPDKLIESPEMVTQTMPALGFNPLVCERTAKWLTTQKRKRKHLNQYNSSSSSSSRISRRPASISTTTREFDLIFGNLFHPQSNSGSDNSGITSVRIQYQHSDSGSGVVGHLSSPRRSPFQVNDSESTWAQGVTSSWPIPMINNHSSSSGTADFSDINATPQSITKNETITQECVVCLDKKKTVLILPCKHLCVCSLCVKRLEKCPVCRKNIKKALDVYQ